MSVVISDFGKTASGAQARLYRLSDGDLQAAVTDYGAAVVSLLVPDAAGHLTDVVTGYDSAADYEAGSCYFGAVVGRVANRVAGAAFPLHGKLYHLDRNEGENCLHSGFSGYQNRIWEAAPLDNAVTFRLHSPDGDQGFPGNLDLQVTYRLRRNGLEICYHAVCDQDTPLNVTNHTYFNLNGHAAGSILQHTLQLAADGYTPLRGPDCIPSGRIGAIAGTPFDFRHAKPIGLQIDAENIQLRHGGGYDHNFVTGSCRTALRPVARARGDRSGIVMETLTDLPGVQFYAGNSIPVHTGKAGAVYGPRCAFCLETQYFPNAVNIPAFPSCMMEAGRYRTSRTVYRFSV